MAERGAVSFACFLCLAELLRGGAGVCLEISAEKTDVAEMEVVGDLLHAVLPRAEKQLHLHDDILVDDRLRGMTRLASDDGVEVFG